MRPSPAIMRNFKKPPMHRLESAVKTNRRRTYYDHVRMVSDSDLPNVASVTPSRIEQKQIDMMMRKAQERRVYQGRFGLVGYDAELARIYQWFKDRGLEMLYAATIEVAEYERTERFGA